MLQNVYGLNHWSVCQNLVWEDANYSGRKMSSFAHHTIPGGLPKLGGPVCAVSQNSALFKQDIGPRLRWVWLITWTSYLEELTLIKLFLSFVSVGQSRHTLNHVGVSKETKATVIHYNAISEKRPVEGNLMYLSAVKMTSIASFVGKYWCWQSLDVACTMT